MKLFHHNQLPERRRKKSANRWCYEQQVQRLKREEPVNKSLIPIGAMIDELCPRYCPNHVNFSCEIDKNVPDKIYGYRYYLQKSLYHLLSNAFKFTEAGNISLDVFLHGDELSTLCFVVRDTGVGIAKDRMSKIWDVFEQAHPEYDAGQVGGRYGGLGLGLAIVDKFVTIMNGDVVAGSELEKGSTFCLCLHQEEVDKF